jgi:hypothetical protein
VKILTICKGGLIRSVALASVLRYKAGHDPIAYGVEKGTPETMRMLCYWADRVVLMQAEYGDFVVQYYGTTFPLCVCDVGPDIWSNPLHPDLQTKVNLYVTEWATCGYAHGFQMRF